MTLIEANDENLRINALKELGILDSEEEEEFNALVKAASLICGVPMSFISLVDVDRQWFKAGVGLPGVTETPREYAFCAHCILQDEVLEVNDTKLDPRFSDNPLVTGSPNIRFYAGAPLKLSNGFNVGSLCVIDNKPNQLTDTQRQILKNLATVTSRLLENHVVRRNEQNLIAEKMQIINMAQHINESIIFITIDGVITFWNHAAETMFGIKEIDVIGKNINSIKHKTGLRDIKSLENILIETPTGSIYETKLKNAIGKNIDVSVSLSANYDKEGVLIGATKVIRDITESKKNERLILEQKEELKKSTQLLNQTGFIAKVGGWELDLITNEIVWTEETRKIHGVPTDYEPNLSSALNFYPSEARLVIENAINIAIKEGVGWDVELPFIQANGNNIIIRAIGNVEYQNNKAVKLTGTIQDLTEIISNRNAIEKLNQRVNLATHSANIGIWDYNHNDDLLIWDNHMYTLYGYLPGKVKPEYSLWAKHLHPEDRERAEAELSDCINQIKPFDTEFRIIWNDGSVHYIRATAVINYDKNNQVISTVGANWDVTEARLLAINLQHAYNDLEEFTSVASHDLKSPLQGIANLTEWIQEDLGENVDEKVKENLNRVQLRIQRLEILINDLLTYSRAGRTEENIGLVNASEILNEIIDMQHIPPNFKVSINGEIKPFQTYKTPLKTILRNIISNAIKHHDKEDGLININQYVTAGFAVFEIKDNGPGIPETAHNRIFKLFQSLKKNENNSGVGLAVSKRMAEVHGGRIELESNDSTNGTIFRVFWPYNH